MHGAGKELPDTKDRPCFSPAHRSEVGWRGWSPGCLFSPLPRSESLRKALLSLCLAPSPCPKCPRGFIVHCKQLWPLFSPSRSRLAPRADLSAWPSTTRSSGKRLPALSMGLVPRRSPRLCSAVRGGAGALALEVLGWGQSGTRQPCPGAGLLRTTLPGGSWREREPLPSRQSHPRI